MKYSELLNLILAKLNLTAEEAQYDRILDKIPGLCNEALGDIANRGKPLYKLIIVTITNKRIASEPLENEIRSSNRFVTFPGNFLTLTNELIQRAKINVDEDGVLTELEDYNRIDGRHFTRYSSRQLLFPKDNDYRYLVQSKCRYPRITGKEDTIEIDDVILELLPNYVVSELIRVDDLTLATSYRNLYEAALAALDDSVLDPAGDLYNEGW